MTEIEKQEKDAKRKYNHLHDYIFNNVLKQLFIFLKDEEIQKYTLIEYPIYNVFQDAESKCLTYKTKLEYVVRWFNKRICNLFCFGSNNETYKDTIRIIALYLHQKNLI